MKQPLFRGTRFSSSAAATALVALAALGLAGCEDATRPVAPERSGPTPLFSITQSGPVDLGDFYPSAINNLGQVAGVRITASNEEPVVWTPSAPGATTGSLVDLPFLPVGSRAFAGGINDVGRIAGKVAVDPGSGFVHRAVFWTLGPTATTIVDLGSLGGCCAFANDINDAGQVVGAYYIPLATGGWDVHAFLWTPSAPGATTGAFVDLGTIPGGTYSHALGVNNLGEVVGISRDAAGSGHAFLWTPTAPGASTGTMIDLGTLPGGTTSHASSINDFGQIVGTSEAASRHLHATLWTVSSSGTVALHDLDPDGIQSSAKSINNLGQVVGTLYIPGTAGRQAFGFVWTPSEGMTFLRTLGACATDAHIDFCAEAVGINDRGEIVGGSWTGSAYRATRWTVQVVPPTPVEQVEAIADQVDALVAEGAVGQGQGNALAAKLDAAMTQLNKGNTKAAINLLEAFIRQCEAYVAAGILTAAQAQPLIDAAQGLIDEFGES